MARGTPVPPPPQLGGAEFYFRESRNVEQELGELRGVPVPNVWGWLDGRGWYQSNGRPLVDGWTVAGAKSFALHPGQRSAAFHVVHPPPEPLTYGWPLRPDSPPMSSLPCFRIADARGLSASGLDFSPDGRMLANIEWLRTGGLCIYDLATGTRHFLTTLEGVGGSEVPTWSTDGRWLLIPSSRPKLVAVYEGFVIDLDVVDAEHVEQVDWWPQRGPSCLLVLCGRSNQRIECLDLATNERSQVSPIHMTRQEDLDPDRHILRSPKVSPDGGRLLVGSSLGPVGEYQRQVGSRARWALVDLTNGQLQHYVSPWCDPGEWVERDHDSWRWIARPQYAGEVVVHGSLREQARPFEAADPSVELFKPAERDESVVLWTW